MSSVTQRIKEIKQPRGGYIKIKDFKTIRFDDGKVLKEAENADNGLAGRAVDYMDKVYDGHRKGRRFFGLFKRRNETGY